MAPATETSNDGIVVTSPSPTVSTVYVFSASRKGCAVLKDANQKTCDDIDASDQNCGERVSLAEARRAIHRSVKFRFMSNLQRAGCVPVFRRSALHSGRHQWPFACQASRPM